MIYTQAQNDELPVSSSVSNQTGLPNISIPLVTLSSSDIIGDPTTRNLSLQFSVLAAIPQNNNPFGIGWDIGCLSVFEDNKKFKISTGQQYSYSHMDVESGRIFFLDQKTQDFAVFYNSAEDYYRVVHKDGVVEILYSSGYQRYSLTSLFFPNGEKFDFLYRNINFVEALSRITDGDGSDILSLKYENYRLNSAKIRLAVGEVEYFFDVASTGGKNTLNNIHRPTGTPKEFSNTAVEYDDIYGHNIITKIQYDEGLVETFVYETGGHKYDTGNGVSTVPRVREHVRDPGAHMAPTVCWYKYPDESEGSVNFLGYPNKYDWSNDMDNIYAWGNASEYSYWVEVITSPGTPAEGVHRATYNTFHLKTAEVVSSMGCILESAYEYPCDFTENREKVFADQPCNLKFPTKISKKYYRAGDDSSTTFETFYDTDEYGNVLREKLPSGPEKFSDYYSFKGESGSCPPDPFNSFNRFLKRTTIKATDGIVMKTRKFKYQSLHPLTQGAAEISTVIKPSAVDICDGDDCVATATFSYLAKVGSFVLHNRFSNCKFVMHSTSADTKSYSTSALFEYKVENTLITKKTTVQGYDNTQYSFDETSFVNSDLIVRETDRCGVKSEASYDLVGNVLTTTQAVGTDYEKSIRYQYHHIKDSSRSTSIIRTTSNGVKYKYTADGYGRTVSTARTLTSDPKDDVYYDILSRSFDEKGKITSETTTDYRPSGEELCSVTSKLRYDGWGEVCEKETNDGVVEITHRDPILMQKTVHTVARNSSGEVIASLAPEVTTFNKSKLPTEIERRSTVGIISTTIEYDRLGRKAKLISPMKYGTSFESYDVFDRVLRVKDPLNRVIRTKYAPFSPKELVSTISVQFEKKSVQCGVRQFDGIGRMISKAVEGYTTKYSFNDGQTDPSTVTTPSGGKIMYGYDGALPDLPISISSSSETSDPVNISKNTYQYSKHGETRGYLVKAENENAIYEVSYGPSGALHCVVQSQKNSENKGKPVKTTYNKRSLAGRLLSVTHESSSGKIDIEQRFDNVGRLLSTTQSGTEISLGYDELGRTKTESVKDKNGNLKQSTELSFDDLNREVCREIRTHSGGVEKVYAIANEHDVESRIVKKTVKVNGVLKLAERFQYDKCNRLTHHRVVDGYDPSFLPSSASGLPIIAHEWTFGILDNITMHQRKLEGSQVEKQTMYYQNDQSTRLNRVHTSIYDGSTSNFLKEDFFYFDGEGNVKTIVEKGINTDRSIHLKYTTSGRTLSVNDSSEQGETTFRYDPFERIVGMNTANQYYLSSDVILEEDGNNRLEFTRCGSHVVAEKEGEDITYLGMSHNKTALIRHTKKTSEFQAFDVYGSGDVRSRTGFVGERKFGSGDNVFYLLGDGTRNYLPNFAMFSSMDTFSPFRAGGINPYMYCYGNAVNLVDPLGRYSVETDLALNTVGLVGAILMTIATGGAGLPAALGLMSAVIGGASAILGMTADSMAIHDRNQNLDRSRAISIIGLTSSITGAIALATGALGGALGGIADDVMKSGKYVVNPKRGGTLKTNARRSHVALTESGAEDVGGVTLLAGRSKRADIYLMAKGKGAKFAKVFKAAAGGLGIDIDNFKYAVNGEHLLKKRALHGMWAVAQGGGLGISGTLLTKGTWAIESQTSEEEGDVEKVYEDVVKQVIDLKHP